LICCIEWIIFIDIQHDINVFNLKKEFFNDFIDIINHCDYSLN